MAKLAFSGSAQAQETPTEKRIIWTSWNWKSEKKSLACEFLSTPALSRRGVQCSCPKMACATTSSGDAGWGPGGSINAFPEGFPWAKTHCVLVVGWVCLCHAFPFGCCKWDWSGKWIRAIFSSLCFVLKILCHEMSLGANLNPVFLSVKK